MTSIQQQEKTINDLNNYRPSFDPFYVLSIGGDEYDYSVNMIEELQEHIKNIYENINEYKGDKIVVWWECGTGNDDSEVITTIQECRKCYEDICCCVEEEIPKCLECDNDASKNKYYPDSEGGKYWTLCEKCYELDQEEEIRNIDTVD